jgi:exportin-T
MISTPCAQPQIADSLATIMDPLLTKVFSFLSRTPTGTDDSVAQSDLKKAYLTFLNAVFNSEVQDVLLMNSKRCARRVGLACRADVSR